LITKLGLSGYRNVGPLIQETVQPKYVRLPLAQHVGAPAEPVVRTGDQVRAGDVVARPPEGKLGAVIHASIDGRVTVYKDAVTIAA